MKISPAQLAKLIAIVSQIVVNIIARQMTENNLSADEAIDLAEKRLNQNSDSIDDLLNLNLEAE